MIRELLYGLVFALVDLVSREEPSDVLISPHYSPLEPDTQQLIRRLPDRLGKDSTLYLSVSDPDDLEQLSTNSQRVELVEPDTLSFVSALRKSRLVILRGRTHLHSYRFFGRNARRQYLLIYHGIITKAYGEHATDSREQSGLARLRGRISTRYLSAALDSYSVASEVESFFRSSAEGRNPNDFRRYGYPRYDRAYELIEGIDDPDLDDDTQALLETEQTTVLYAPTHKDGQYSTTLFPFEDTDVEALRAHLEDHDIQLLLRMHPVEEESGAYDDLVDGTHIHYVGQDVAPSPMELLPYVDVLVTDYSSIYVDFLPFDRPIVFVPDRHDEFSDVRGIAFDYERYFPGKSVRSMSVFLDHVTDIAREDEDGYGEQREFVRTVLLPAWDENTVKTMCDQLL